MTTPEVPRIHGIAVTHKSWAEICFIVLLFALALGIVQLAAFDREHEAKAATTESSRPSGP